MNQVYLLIGGNIGDRVNYLKNAVALINGQAAKIVKQSSIFETAAWGIEDQEAFLNQVILIETKLSAQKVLEEILRIEEILGRKRLEKYGARAIDIDILLYNDDVITEPDLVIPHPALPARRFALTPLCEIAPRLMHPTLKRSVAQLLEECKDPLRVEKFEAFL